MIDRITGGQTTTVATIPSNSGQGDTINVKSSEPINLSPDKKDEHSILKAKLQKVIDGMNEFVQASNTHLKFELHDELNEYYVSIIDDKTQEVIKEIPSKKMLDIYAEMEKHLGILVDKKV
ncbi:flagellar protein FlaG [Bacillus sp. FJAT-49736]|uniref:flagellar protein FlaG n=1 Tax=Bacillus sp. FJAT-49736 TaxID=2833582 RepID=UPI001BC8E696|nr:flagellar protein FlaG [Bacillus sp. FJAT-49736]MBS4174148.1 flagellar protein FlaG [Bacillus sp. FJAT-49736]